METNLICRPLEGLNAILVPLNRHQPLSPPPPPLSPFRCMINRVKWIGNLLWLAEYKSERGFGRGNEIFINTKREILGGWKNHQMIQHRNDSLVETREILTLPLPPSAAELNGTELFNILLPQPPPLRVPVRQKMKFTSSQRRTYFSSNIFIPENRRWNTQKEKNIYKGILVVVYSDAIAITTQRQLVS